MTSRSEQLSSPSPSQPDLSPLHCSNPNAINLALSNIYESLMDFLKFGVVAFMEFGLISWKVNIFTVLHLSCINSSPGSSNNSTAVLMALCLQRLAFR